MVTTENRAKFINSIITIFSVLMIFCGSLSAIYFVLKSNIHTIIPQEFYRSGQLTTDQLTKVIKKYDIHSIVNLRLPSVGKSWYSNEVAMAQQSGINHFTVGLSGYQLPKVSDLKMLVSILLNQPKPMLIHCKGGADRTGLAAAIIILLNNGSLDEAKKQVSWKYFAVSPQSVGYLILSQYKNWLDKNNLSSSKQNFLNWLDHVSLKTVSAKKSSAFWERGN